MKRSLPKGQGVNSVEFMRTFTSSEAHAAYHSDIRYMTHVYSFMYFPMRLRLHAGKIKERVLCAAMVKYAHCNVSVSGLYAEVENNMIYVI